MFKCTSSAPVAATESFRISIEDEALVRELSEQAAENIAISDAIDTSNDQADTLAGTIDLLESKETVTEDEVMLSQAALDMMGAGHDARAEDFGLAVEGTDVMGGLQKSLDRLKEFLLQLLVNVKNMLTRLYQNARAFFEKIFTGVEYRKRHLASLKKRLDVVKTVPTSSGVVRIQTSLDHYIAAGRVAKDIRALGTEISAMTKVILGFTQQFESVLSRTIPDMTKIIADTTLDNIDVEVFKLGGIVKGMQDALKGTLGGGRHTQPGGSSLYCSRYILGQKAIVMRFRDTGKIQPTLADMRGTRFALLSSFEIEDRKLQVQPFDMAVGSHSEVMHLVTLIEGLLDSFVVKVKEIHGDFMKKYHDQINNSTSHVASYVKTLKAGEQSDVNKQKQADFAGVSQLPGTMLDWINNPATAISSHTLSVAQTLAALAERMVLDYEARVIKQKA